MSEYPSPDGLEVNTVRSAPIVDDVAPVTSRKRSLFPLPRLPKIEPKKPPAKAKFSDIFTKTDINGFPDWYEAPNWPMKIAWTVILLAAITLLTLELVHTIQNFLDNPILTTYSLVNEPDGMKFPEVYLCPTNPIHMLQYKKLNVDGGWERKHADGIPKVLKVLKDICIPKVLKGCAAEIIKGKKKEIEECTRGCNLLCNYWEYQMSLSASAFPTHALKNAGDLSKLSEDKLKETEDSQRAHFCSGPLRPPTTTQRNECPTTSTVAPLPTTLLILLNATDIEIPVTPPLLPATVEPNSTTLWYWNQTEEDCLSREFRWCPELDYDPARNLGSTTPGTYFLTRTKCLHNCGYGNPCLAWDNTPKDPSERPPKRKDGSDRRGEMRYTWLMDEGRCVRYYGYGVGGATENDFDTRELCEQKCNGNPCNINSYSRCISYYYATHTAVDRECIEQPALVPANNCTRTPTGNHYLDFWDCKHSCERKNNDSTNCTGSAFSADGNCMEVERRYFYEPHLGWCQPFDYIGCPMAKGNAFKTKEECEDTCVKTIVKPSGWKSNIPLTNPTPNEGAKREVIQSASKLNIRPSKWSKGDMIVLDIAFSSLQYIELSQEPSMTFTTFVSNVGGQVGLWVGCSVVTIVKLFLVVMPLCLRWRKKRAQTEHNN